MALSGSLAEFSVEQILRFLELSGQTGTLVVRTHQTRASIEVTRGAVTAARGEEDPEAALGLVLGSGEGTFAFSAGPTGEPQVTASLDELLARARAKAAELLEIRSAIPDEDSRFRLSDRATSGGSFTVAAEELRALMAVGGGRTVREVRQQLRYGKGKTRALLYGLIQKDLITPAQVPTMLIVETTGPIAAEGQRSPRARKRQREQARATAAPPLGVPSVATAPIIETVPVIETALEAVPVIEPTPAGSAAAAELSPLDEGELREELDARLAALASLGQETAAAATSEEATPDAPDAAVAADLIVVTPSAIPAPAGAAAAASGGSQHPAPPEGTVVFRLHYLPSAAQPQVEPARPEPPPPSKRRGIFDLFRLRRPARAGGQQEVLDIPSPGELAALASALSEEYERLAEAKRQLASLPRGAFADTIAARLARIYAIRPIGARVPLKGDAIDVVAIRQGDLPPAQILPYLALLIRDLRREAERAFGADEARATYETVVARAFGRTIATPTRILRRADQSLRARLTIRTGGGGGPFELRDRAYVIGRAPTCDIVLGDASISARHARLLPDLAGFRISDLGSTNGTTVDGTRLEGERLLRGGQMIGIGDALLLYEQMTEDPGA